MKQNPSRSTDTNLVSGAYSLEEQIRCLRQAYGGETWPESEERKGSTFHFSLPLT